MASVEEEAEESVDDVEFFRSTMGHVKLGPRSSKSDKSMQRPQLPSSTSSQSLSLSNSSSSSSSSTSSATSPRSNSMKEQSDEHELWLRSLGGPLFATMEWGPSKPGSCPMIAPPASSPPSLS